MNAIHNDFAAKLAPLRAESWSAWRVGARESDPIKLDAPDTLDEAVAQAMAGILLHPKDVLAIEQRHAGRNGHTLTFYSVKRSTKRFAYRESLNGGSPVRVSLLEAVLSFQMRCRAPFEPVERFDALRDEAVGIDRQLIEGRAA